MTLTNIFVYGTLRRGASNHARLHNAIHLGAAAVHGRLYHIDWYPGLVLDPTAPLVHGEVYAVDDRTLTELDAFEGNTEYQRKIANVEMSDGTLLEVQLWEYILPIAAEKIIPSGDWLNPLLPWER